MGRGKVGGKSIPPYPGKPAPVSGLDSETGDDWLPGIALASDMANCINCVILILLPGSGKLEIGKEGRACKLGTLLLLDNPIISCNN